MNFCDICDSRLQEVTTDTKLYYQCSKCQKRYDAKVADTLMYEEVMDRKDSMIKYDTFLRNAAFDPANPLSQTPCPKCDAQFVRHVVIGKMKKYIFVCECGHRF
jgi:DNA-directed RNA polymerase subunit M/transcription elongation factor TFIIS